MKIAFFTDTYYPHLNGVTISVDNFATYLRKKGHTVYIFAPKINDYQDKDKHVFRLSSIKMLSSAPEARMPVPVPNSSLKQAFTLDFDLIHAHGNGAFSILGYQVAKMKGVPYILTFHTLMTEYTHYVMHGKIVKPRMVAAAFRVYGNLCDGIVAPSEKMKRKLFSYGISKDIEVVPNFINFAPFDHPARGYLHKLCQLPSETPLLLSVGRLGPEKNFEFLIRMFHKLAQQDKKAHLVIVGRGSYKEKLQELIDDLNLSERVHLPGSVEAKYMPHVYADAELFVFASRTETQGICVLEAAAAGLPLVAANDAAFDNILFNNVNGFTLPLNQHVFSKKILLLLKDHTLRKKMGKNSYDISRENFAAKELTETLFAFYQKIYDNYYGKQQIIHQINRFNKATLVRIQRAAEVMERLFTTEI